MGIFPDWTAYSQVKNAPPSPSDIDCTRTAPIIIDFTIETDGNTGTVRQPAPITDITIEVDNGTNNNV